MKLIGRNKCEEKNDENWRVGVLLCDGSPSIDVSEQINRTEATELFEKIQKAIETSQTGFIEVETSRGDISDKRFINIHNICEVIVQRY